MSRDPDDLLRERARRLAEPPPQPGAAAALRSVVRFSLAGEIHAIDLHHVAEVLPLRSLTPLPGAPDLYRGVSYERGRILPVLDGRRLLGLPERDPDPRSQIVHLTVGPLDLGLLVDGDVTVGTIPARGLPPLRPDDGAAAAGLVEGVAPGRIVILDASRIAADPRLRVTASSPDSRSPSPPNSASPSP